MFVGVSWLAVHMHARPTATGTPSVLSEIARAVFPSSSALGFMYWAVQVLTLAVLVLAANTSYQGFPRLAALLARDRFFARQFTNLGDRLVFSNGIIVLTAIAMALLWVYNASVDSLIHLYVIGVFTAFTLSQAGMVRYWLRTRDSGLAAQARHQRRRCDGDRRRDARRHLDEVRRGRVARDRRDPAARRVLPRHQPPLPPLRAAPARRRGRRGRRRPADERGAPRRRGDRRRDRGRALVRAPDRPPDSIRALHRPGRHTDSGIRARWFDFAEQPRLEILPTNEGRVQPLLEEVWRLPRGESDFVTVVVPEQFKRASLLSAARRDVVPAQAPAALRARRRRHRRAGGDRPSRPGRTHAERLVVRVLVANVHAGSLRALAYAQSLGVEDTRAVSFAFDADEAAKVRAGWTSAGIQLPLDLHEAPYRDIGAPLLAYLRELTADPDTVVNVVMPEVVVRGWARVLHNQRALYIKRLLLFERHVILSSVPYQLFR